MHLVLQGLDKLGNPYINPLTQKSTKYWHADDPIAGVGWLDENPGDRRFLMSTGSFSLADRDSQEVVLGMVIAQGKTGLESVTQMKRNVALVQLAYDAYFALPTVPSAPSASVSPDTTAILLAWDNAVESYAYIDHLNRDENGNSTTYTFQGYNVYQLDAPVVLPETKIVRRATFDRSDGVTEIRDDVLEVETGEIVNRIVQHGTDNGIHHYLRVTRDMLRNEDLLMNRQYYFAVTAYAYNPYGFPKTLESPLEIITIRPQSPPPGYRWTTPFGDTLVISHTGNSTGAVYPIVIDPAALTGNDYKVSFRTSDDGTIVWDVTNTTINQMKTSGWVNQGFDGDNNYPIVDGILVQTFGPPEAINTWSFAPSADRWFTGVNWGGAELFGGMDIGKNFFGSNITPDQYVTVEIRFLSTPTGQRAYDYVRGGTPSYGFRSYEPQHFTAWDVTANPPRQINVAFVEQASTENDLWDPGVGSGGRNYLFILHSTYSGDTPDPHYTGLNALGQADEFDTMYAMWPTLRGSRTAPEWADGQVFTIVPNFINTPKDVFTYKTTAPIRNDLALAKRQTAQLVNVYPNPYRGFNIEERSAAERFVTFTHLPETAKIQIFTLSGTPVCTLIHNNGTQYERWDLRNSRNIPVASGIYLVHIDMGAIGAKVLKLVVFQPEEGTEGN